MSGRYRHFDIAVIGLACCIGALALGGMLFMYVHFCHALTYNGK